MYKGLCSAQNEYHGGAVGVQRQGGELVLRKERMTNINWSINGTQKDSKLDHSHQHSKEFLHLQIGHVNRKSTLDLC